MGYLSFEKFVSCPRLKTATWLLEVPLTDHDIHPCNCSFCNGMHTDCITHKTISKSKRYEAAISKNKSIKQMITKNHYFQEADEKYSVLHCVLMSNKYLVACKMFPSVNSPTPLKSRGLSKQRGCTAYFIYFHFCYISLMTGMNKNLAALKSFENRCTYTYADIYGLPVVELRLR